MFVLRDIVRLPDAQITDRPNGAVGLERGSIETYTPATGAVLVFSAHQAETRVKWLREIGQYGSDPLALHEHAIDDLRIDPSQTKADGDADTFRLPPRIDAHEPDLVRPSEVAQDYLPTAVRTPVPTDAVAEQATVEQTAVSSELKQTSSSSTSTTLRQAASTGIRAETATAIAQQQSSSVAASATTTATSVTKVLASQESTAAVKSTTIEQSKTVDTKQQQSVTQSAHVKSAAEVKVEVENQINLSKSLAAKSSVESVTVTSVAASTALSTAEKQTSSSQVAATVQQTTPAEAIADKPKPSSVPVEVKKEVSRIPKPVAKATVVDKEPSPPHVVAEPKTPNASAAAALVSAAATEPTPKTPVQGIYLSGCVCVCVRCCAIQLNRFRK